MQSNFCRRIFIAFTLVLALASAAVATEPSKFAVLTSQPGSLPIVGLNGEVLDHHSSEAASPVMQVLWTKGRLLID
jgi:hypothetical protein